VRLPPVAGEGRCIVTIDASAKIKQKQASGSGTGDTPQDRAAKAETTVEAIEPCDVEIDYAWTYRIHNESEAALYQLNPNGPNGGQPVDLRHPEADANDVRAVMIAKFGSKKRAGGMCSIKITAKEWNPPPPPAPGDAAETPTQVGKWTASYGGKPGVPVGPPSAWSDTAGMNGKNAPTAKP
jgi:hypothetical protein